LEREQTLVKKSQVLKLVFLKHYHRKQLYVMYDTSQTGKPELAGLIEKFWIKMDLIDFNNPNPPPQNPSNKANIWRHLFPIHPLSSIDPPSIGRLGRFYEGTCGICLDEFADTKGRVLARLHCDHWFHFTCIRKWVDDPDKVSFRCALCQANWRLHDAAGITPETRALDVWDYEELMGADEIYGRKGTNPRPDLTVFYHNRDDEMANASLQWNDTTGYPGGAGIKRAPATEMATYRKMRRIRNENRRAYHEEARLGFYGLDPAIADALIG
jgi:hypothetical protein